MTSLTEQQSAPLTRRELRELEREAERREKLALLEAQAEAARRAAAERERREAEQARAAAQAAQSATTASVEPAAPVAESKPEAAVEPAAPAEQAPASEPVFMSRRERREAERAAEAKRLAELEQQSLAASKLAVERNPELFAGSQAAAAQADEAETIAFPEQAAETVVDTLDPVTGPIVLAPVVSLDEVRAAREEGAEIVPQAPVDEPEVEIPESFSASDEDEQGDRRSSRGRRSGRIGGGMFALSFVAGAVVIGSGTAAGIAMVNSPDEASATAGLDEEEVAQAQSLAVGAEVEVSAEVERSDEITAVTSIGTAAAANLATGVELPDSKAYTNDITANVQWPFPMGVEISSPYGFREAPTAGASTFHGGVDFTPGIGTPIGSMADGLVTKVDEAGGSGSGVFVEVQHMIEGERVTTVYAHLKPETIVVEEGDTISVGDEIAQVGNTGISTGPHLHFEVHVQGKYVDPIYFLTEMNVSGVKVEVPETVGPDVGLGGDEKLPVEESHALVDSVFGGKAE